jgi:hypothetical protein
LLEAALRAQAVRRENVVSPDRRDGGRFGPDEAIPWFSGDLYDEGPATGPSS